MTAAPCSWQQKVVEQYVEEHLTEPISLAALAQLAHLSLFHFGRAFKQSFGTPPHRYHTMRRIEIAKTLLARPGLSVTEIAMRLGFAETSAFSTTFRKAAGRRPSDFRRGLL
jgi:AraC family transcriptional regulator